MPLENVPGGDNPEDLMTNNVSFELAIKHMRAAGIRFEEGRAASASQLHNIGPEDVWIRADDDKKPEQPTAAKVQSRSRRELFTPSGNEDYACPGRLGNLAALRRTIGQTKSGKHFEIEDNWRRPDRAHRELEE